MGGRVVREFCHGKEVCPFLRVSVAEDAEVGFQLLIYSLGFSVCLWVVGRGEFKVIF